MQFVMTQDDSTWRQLSSVFTCFCQFRLHTHR